MVLANLRDAAAADLQGSLDDKDWPAAPVFTVADRIIFELDVLEFLRQ